MSEVEPTTTRLTPEPLPDNIPGVQPGGGFTCGLEQRWGQWRRRFLKRFCPGYVERMAQLRRGDCTGAPHEVLDPRDLKYIRNRCGCHWAPADDPFRWRGNLGFARWGLAELQVMAWPLLAITIAVGCYRLYLALIPAVLLGLVVWFFRDPRRTVPQGPGLIVSPADGTIAEVVRVDHDDFVGGPALKIGIFLSIFNVHLNRAPSRSRAIRLRYYPGKFLNALDPTSALVNENMWIGLEEEDPPHRRIVVRQIAGAIARRIVCDLAPGEVLERGQKFGMIKFGSRTELILPDNPRLQIDVSVGQKVKAGSTVVARYQP